jgi:alpha-D-ribose 1-methylphosphonate 5-triphosphate synthase subunit PhnH
MESLAIDGGFAQRVAEAQRVFRAVMDALANPGSIRSLGAPPRAPANLAVGLAALALTLCDHDSPVWLTPDLAANADVPNWLRFHTGAPLVDRPGEADFCLAASVVSLPPLSAFALGSDEYPDRSTTVCLAVASLRDGAPITLRGPGIRETISFAPLGLPADFRTQWAGNRALFPRGVDLLLVSGTDVVGLPRTTRIAEG